jgi:hypothetical protein
MLELCLRSELLKLILHFYSLRVTFFFLFPFPFFFKFVISKFSQFFCCLHFNFNFHIFSIFFPTRITKLEKFKNKKKHVHWEGNLIQVFSVFTKLCYFYFSNKNESKIYCYIIQKTIVIFFQVV